ncbi:DUF485 domain-containing protein [Saxibacter everestensis]|uniref:DUF485 domain-containing protein n=1 Tax=Saxibacter everestensis TaxID=2909229 RepID=A0ABY8QQ20_9MICO|nr:DUF485 domain-containing protein [Brevibacteriaceae bacterium ZFBP1038]
MSTNHNSPPADDTVPAAVTPYQRVQDSADFQNLRSRFRKFVFPMTAVFFSWYALYVLLSNYAHEFMSIQVFGNVNIGLIFGLLQIVSTFAITTIYVRWANKRQDPIAEALRDDVEAELATSAQEGPRS